MKIPKVSYQIDPFSSSLYVFLVEKFLSISFLVYQLDSFQH